MYKIFFNDRTITIASQIPDYSEDTEFVEANDFTADTIKNWFSDFQQKNDNTVLIHSNPENLMHNSFTPAFQLIQAAGGVVIRSGKILFIFRNGKWDLPKGKLDQHETPENAAIREVAEECGIVGHSIVRQLPSTFHIYQSPYKNDFGKWILKKTFWFEMSYSGTENGTPETGENITEIRWFSTDEFNIVSSNTYGNIKEIISSIIR